MSSVPSKSGLGASCFIGEGSVVEGFKSVLGFLDRRWVWKT